MVNDVNTVSICKWLAARSIKKCHVERDGMSAESMYKAFQGAYAKTMDRFSATGFKGSTSLCDGQLKK